MQIRKFQPDKDLNKLEAYLRRLFYRRQRRILAQNDSISRYVLFWKLRCVSLNAGGSRKIYFGLVL